MFKVPVVKHGINGELRQRGKVAELACIAEDSLVLTDAGLVPIQDVTTEMKLWDGEAWVSHDGVVYRGERDVITYHGLTATPDHMVFLTLHDKAVRFGDIATYKLRPKLFYGFDAPRVDVLYTDTPFPIKKPVYDILNAGPRHRFTVSNYLVHNCGYGGGTGALAPMGALDMGLKESELPDLISDWRNANPNIVRYWRDVEDAAIQTVTDHREHRVRFIAFRFEANTLWMVLPSGRRIAYANPRLQPNRFGRMGLTFEGLDKANGWSRQETYAGKLVENATQAIARDLLTGAMWRLEQAGFDIVAHVHDEVIIESPTGAQTVDEVCKIMNQSPDWCRDLPLSSAGYTGSYYFKD
jgi:DNA polymerase